MLTHPTLEQMRALKLDGMAEAFIELVYDSTAAWRERAMTGVLHSGEVVNDPRSSNRTAS